MSKQSPKWIRTGTDKKPGEYNETEGYKKVRERVLRVVNDMKGTGQPQDRAALDKLTDMAAHALEEASGEPIRPHNYGGPGVSRDADEELNILAHRILAACRAAGFPDAVRYNQPESLAVSLYKALAPLVFPGGDKNVRRIFEAAAPSRKGGPPAALTRVLDAAKGLGEPSPQAEKNPERAARLRHEAERHWLAPTPRKRGRPRKTKVEIQEFQPAKTNS